MKILGQQSIEHVRVTDLAPGMVLPDGIIKDTEPSGPNLLLTFFGGNTGWIANDYDRRVQVLARVSDTLLANMMGR